MGGERSMTFIGRRPPGRAEAHRETRAGTPIACMALVKDRKNINCDGPSGPLEFSAPGEPQSATYVISEIQASGTIKPLTSRENRLVSSSAADHSQQWSGQPPRQRQHSHRRDGCEQHQHAGQHYRRVRLSRTHTQVMVEVQISSGHELDSRERRVTAPPTLS